MKRVLSVILSVVFLLGCMSGISASAEQSRPFLSASDQWTMGSGWVDCSTTEAVAFENTTETAGPNFNRDLINGSEGFRIGFDVSFLDPAKQTTANVTLRLNSNTMAYFRILVTGRGDEGLFQVDYCDNGSWITAVPLVDRLMGTGGRIRTVIEREAGSEKVRFTLYAANGTELFSKACSNRAFSPGRFLDRSDLEFIVAPIPGYGCFRFSDYTAATYPDDGIEEQESVSDLWDLGANWVDESDETGTAIGNRIPNAGPCFYKEQFDGSKDFSVSFRYTGKSDYTTADMTLRLTSQNNVYLRMLLTQNNGTALAELNFYDGSRWTQLFTTGWVAEVGKTYDVLLEHTGGADTIRTALKKTDGTVFFENESTGATCTNSGFYSVSKLEALVTTAGNYGLFTIRDFKLVSAPEEVGPEQPEPITTDLWNYGSGWAAYPNGEDDIALTKTDRSQTEAVYTRYIEGSKGFRVNFDITFDRPEDSSCYFKLRIPSGNEIYLFARVKGSNQQTLLEAQSYIAAEDNWSTSLLSAAAAQWRANNGTVTVTLERKALSDSMAFRATDKLTGEVLFDETITSEILTPEAFLDYDGLQWIFGADGGSGTFRICQFRVEDYPAEPVPAVSAAIDGPDRALTAEPMEFLAEIDPPEATLKSLVWTLDGSRLGTGKKVNCRFDEAGSYTLTLTVTDWNENVLTAEKKLTIEPAPVVYDPLDLNRDGAVDAQDAQCILNAAVGLEPLEADLAAQADLNGDGVLSAEDAYLLLTKTDLPARGTRTAEDLPEPAPGTYRFNGHWVTDRSSFLSLISDWKLRSSTDSAPVIVAGTPGEGVSYEKALPKTWYLQTVISTAANDDNGLILCSANQKILEIALQTADDQLTLKLNGDPTPLGAVSGSVKLILDNRSDGLLLYAYAGETFLGGIRPELPAALGSIDCITFRATRPGTEFSGFGVNDMPYAYSDDPGAALELVERFAKREIEGSIVYADNGVPMYTPDGVKNYNALWTRDFTYMLEYGRDFIPTENAVACIEYLLEHVHEGDCWLPDRVYANGAVNYAAGDMPFSRANLDNNAFIVIALDCVLPDLGEAEGKALFTKWETTLRTALDALAKDENGLVYNDPLNPHSPYGFTDCICKTGSLMKESLLLWRAETIMAKWQKAYGLDATEASRNAKRIEDVLVDTFRNTDGMLNAATEDCCQTDVWGSCYAVSIGFPLPEALKKSISDYIAANYDGLVQMGQLRHTAPGTYWQRLLSGVDEGTYQNGAYWATPSGWLIDTLEPYHPELAMITLQDLITYFAQEGIFECVNGTYQKLNHYGASASNIVPAARRLLNAANALEAVTVTGPDEAKTGAELTFTAALTPANVRISSWEWTVNGTPADGAETLTRRFPEAGIYTVCCKATDLNGRSQEGSLTLTVTDGEYRPVVMTVTPISGDAGDEVEVAFGLEADSMLVFADLEISYDAAGSELLAEENGAAASAAEGFRGVLAAKEAEPGKLTLALASGLPITAEGALFTVRFRLREKASGLFPVPSMQSGGIDAQDGSGTHTPEFRVRNLDAADPCEGYDDIERDSWYHAAADYVIEHGYMGSTSQTALHFEPLTNVSRAMVASILYRICGAPADVEYKGTFSDVPDGQWYTKAVEWCAQNGLASGKGDGRFDPNGLVTRQELAVFMSKLDTYLTADDPDIDPIEPADLSSFPDADSVPAWAESYLKWAVAAGLISGKGQPDGTTLLASTATAMRCELASILQRFLSP